MNIKPFGAMSEIKPFADLSGANLRNANLTGAYLSCANLRSSDLPPYLRLPSTGPFRCWKKLADWSIAELWVPREAGRTSCITSNKCRVERAKVVSIDGVGIDGYSVYNPSVVYRVGEWVEPDYYDDDERVPCTNGIHVFATRQEAVEYDWT